MKTANLFSSVKASVPALAIDKVAVLLGQVERELEQETRSVVTAVEGVGSSTLGAGGKRLRPALAIVSALATGLPFDETRIVRLGASLELIHMATLIHDDVIDESRTRRGRPTAASLFGNTTAILSGDVLLAKAMRALAIDGDIRVIRSVSQSVVTLAEGEVRELEVRGKFELDEREHREILSMKTSSLIECCCRVGAMVARAPQTLEDALAAYGHHLGLAFQLADDLLDFCGEPSKTGKPLGTDFREGQATLPLIHLRPSLTETEARFVSDKFGNGVTDLEVEEICGWMRDRGALEQVRLAARTESRLAQDALTDLPRSPYSELLHSVTQFVTEREA